MTNLEKLQSFWLINSDKAIPFDWLRGRSLSDKLVICIGAGPWKFGRRKKIQGEALAKLAGRDISELSSKEASEFYPLEWQNNFLESAVIVLQDMKVRFEDFCKTVTKTQDMYELCDCNGYTKCLSLFCRDGLEIDSFPIDRHVKRKLEELGLPGSEKEMLELCSKAGLSPRLVAVAFVRTASDMDNPDWSVPNAEAA